MVQSGKQFRKRNAILDFLRHSDQHPSAETIYAQLKPEIPDLSLGTVYRNLALFKQQGLINSLGTVDGVERFDGILTPHVHFICSRCGRIIDLRQLSVPELLCHSAASEVGGTVDHCSLTFYGTCSDCSASDAEPG